MDLTLVGLLENFETTRDVSDRSGLATRLVLSRRRHRGNSGFTSLASIRKLLTNEFRRSITDRGGGAGDPVIGPLDDDQFVLHADRVESAIHFLGVSNRNDDILVAVDLHDRRVVVRDVADRRYVSFCIRIHFVGRRARLITEQLSIGRMLVLDLVEQRPVSGTGRS